VKDLSTDSMIVRTRYAREAVHDAVIAGVTEHGDDFRLTIEPETETEPEPDPSEVYAKS